MRVMVSSGKKTAAIKNALDSRFATGSVTLLIENDIYGVIGCLRRYEQIDKIILVDKAMPMQDKDDGYAEARKAVVDLVECINNEEKLKVVFVTQEDSLAEMLVAETFTVGDRCKIVRFRGDRYVAPFFDKMITSSIDELKDEYFLDKKAKTFVDRVKVEGSDMSEYDMVNTNEPTNEKGLLEGETDEDTNEESQGSTEEQDEAYENQWDRGGGSTEGSELFQDDLYGTTNYDDVAKDDESGGGFDLRTAGVKGKRIDPGYSDNPEGDMPDGLSPSMEDERILEPEMEDDVNINEPRRDKKRRRKKTDDDSESEDKKSREANKNSDAKKGKGGFLGRKNKGGEDGDGDGDGRAGGKSKLGGLFGKPKKKTDDEEPESRTPKKRRKKSSDEDGAPVGHFDESMYDEGESDRDGELDGVKRVSRKDIGGLVYELNQLSPRGKILIFTGVRGAGASTTAYNIASTIARLGFTALLIDLDTRNRSQAFLSRESFEIMHGGSLTDVSLMKAINDPINMAEHTVVVSEGLHIAGLGLGTEEIDLVKKVEKNRMSRFVNIAMDTYQFVVIDTPFDTLCKFASEMAYVSESIIFMTEANTRGLMQLLLMYGGISAEEIQETMFARTKVVLNKTMGKHINAFNKKVAKTSEILRAIDTMAEELTGLENELRFNYMKLVGNIPYIDNYDEQWMAKKSFTDNNQGIEMYMGLLSQIIGG